MSAPERSRAYLEIDSAQIRADTPVEFRQLLHYIRMRAGLTPSQIAIKTTIPRSQAYNMVAGTRTTLPSKPEQVREFVEACGLSPVQVGLVMSLWSKLDQQAREQATGRALSLIDGGAASIPEQITQTSFGGETGPLPLLSEEDFPRRLLLEDSFTRRRKTTPKPRRASADLLFLVLDDADRTRRALKLLLPITLAFVATVASLVVWAILQPGHAPMIGAILGAGVLFPITTSLGRLISGLRR